MVSRWDLHKYVDFQLNAKARSVVKGIPNVNSQVHLIVMLGLPNEKWENSYTKW